MSNKGQKTSSKPNAELPVICEESGDADTCCSSGSFLDRRNFLKWTGLGVTAASGLASPVIAGPFSAEDTLDHFVPADKKLRQDWIGKLFAKGASTWYSEADLETIGMPVGGIAAGQVYLTGDGRLAHWDIFNQHIFTGYGRDSYNLGRKPSSPFAQGFAIQVASAGNTIRRVLDIHGFPQTRFCGEYPIGTIEYRASDFPIDVRLQAFSPFIPLNEEDSALPATLLQFTVKNTMGTPADVALSGWLENAVCLHSGRGLFGHRRNQALREDSTAMVVSTAEAADPPPEVRKPIVLSDFESGDYGDWKVTGEAFGTKPPGGTLDQQQEVSGFQGKGLVNTYLGGNDRLQGTLTSPQFSIDRKFISFLIGGGNHAGKTCMNLLIDGKIVRTATGQQKEQLQWHNWDVTEFADQTAQLEIVDRESTAWGHINIDQIELRDQPKPAVSGQLEEQPDFGSMAVAVLDGDAETCLATAIDGPLTADAILDADFQSEPADAVHPFNDRLVGGVQRRIRLEPNQSATVTFVVAWSFPHRVARSSPRGNFYANRFPTATSVVRYVAQHADRLINDTKRWHETWYHSTLPHWLLDRLFSTVSTLATSTCQWWANGRFWAWEGVGCCHGTCTHVWNYEHSMARLFPRLERSVRELQDYNPEAGFVEETGMIRFRGEGWGNWAADGQAGTVLKAYREHQCTTDNEFLQKNWTRIRKSLEFLISEDGDQNGLLEGSQHNTYDINFFGPNTMIGSLYLAALQAGAAMADIMGDEPFAELCRQLFESGRELTAKQLFNGEYFEQDVDLQKHPQHQYETGCLSDQLFGQGWALQVGLGAVYPQEQIRTTLHSIWKYNWAPDVGPQNAVHHPERWFAKPGEAGLFTCTWPRSPHLAKGVRYRNEVWTGIEYQVAGNMAWEGMLTEALAICRAIHERYHPSKHNPWNEVECGDHYARGMASHGVFLGLCGFQYDGPRGRLGFAPRLTPDNFQAAFTAAAGWGTISQGRGNGQQTQKIHVKWGQLGLNELAFQVDKQTKVAAVAVTCGERELPASIVQLGEEVSIQLDQPVTLGTDEILQVVLSLASANGS
jgi:uncharacterized protein (DUF608 family)